MREAHTGTTDFGLMRILLSREPGEMRPVRSFERPLSAVGEGSPRRGFQDAWSTAFGKGFATAGNMHCVQIKERSKVHEHKELGTWE